MAYSLYIDRNENFECDLSVKNASLKDAKARLVVEGEDVNLMFEGDIRNGRCVVPIRKMKGLLPENTRGKMHLEVIVEDTYFSPWQDQFLVEEHTQVKVQVHEQKKKKPIMEVSAVQEEPKEEDPKPTPSQQLTYIFERFGLDKKSIRSRKGDFQQIIQEYFTTYPSLVKNNKKYIREALSMLR